ncbi:MAG: PaaI family thioesterase [Dehalococcoidia bacterium]
MAPPPDRTLWMRQGERRPLYRALGIRPDDIGEGYAQFIVEPTDASADGRGSVLSFAATTAADQCILDATVTTLDREREETNGTAEMNLTYLETPSGVLTVRGEVAGRGRNLSIVDLTVRNGSGVVIAFGRGSYAVRQLDGGRS